MRPGVNGAIVPARDPQGRLGWVFQAPDGTKGPFHPVTGADRIRAFLAARVDWRAWLNTRKR
jgi:hypothetical protein